MPFHKTNPFVIISTICSHKIGFGHLSRSMTLYFLLKEMKYDVFLLIESKDKEISELVNNKKISFMLVNTEKQEKKYLQKYQSLISLLFVDKGNTSCHFYRTFPFKTIGVDNVGKDKNDFDFLYSPLPYHKPINTNIKGTSFLFFPHFLYQHKRKIELNKPIRKILVTFGGSDPNDLAAYTYEIFKRLSQDYFLTFVLGPLYQGKLNTLEKPKTTAISFVKAPNQEFLTQLMNENDLVITSFGITAFEALTLNTFVFLINQTPYHQELTQATSFPHASFTAQDRDKPFWLEKIVESLTLFLKYPVMAKDKTPKMDNKEFIAFVKDVFEMPLIACPLCKKQKQTILYRTPFYNICYCEVDEIYYKGFFFLKNLKPYLEQEEKVSNPPSINLALWQKSLELLKIALKKGVPGDRKINHLNIIESFDSSLSQKADQDFFDDPLFSSRYKGNRFEEKLMILRQNDSNLFPSIINLNHLSGFNFKYPFYDLVTSFHTLFMEDHLEKIIGKLPLILLPEGFFAFNILLFKPSFFKIPSIISNDTFLSHILFSYKGLKKYLLSKGFLIKDSFQIPSTHKTFLTQFLILAQKVD